MSTCYIVSMEKDLTTRTTEAWANRNDAFVRFANLHLDPDADMLDYADALAEARKAKETYETLQKAEAAVLSLVLEKAAG